jgi:hypothetical protein
MRDILMTIPIVKTAIESDEASIIDALNLAFVGDPATRWVWPEPQKYLLHFSSFVKAFGGKALFQNRYRYYSHLSIIRNILLAIVIILNILPQIEQINALNLNIMTIH